MDFDYRMCTVRRLRQHPAARSGVMVGVQPQSQHCNLQFKFLEGRFMWLMFLMILLMFCSLLDFVLCLGGAYLSCEGILFVTSVLDRLMGRFKPRLRASSGTSSTPAPFSVLASGVAVLLPVSPVQCPRCTRGHSFTGLHSLGGDRRPHAGACGPTAAIFLDDFSGLKLFTAGQEQVQSSQQRWGLEGLLPLDLRNVFFSAGVTGLSWSSSLSISLFVQPCNQFNMCGTVWTRFQNEPYHRFHKSVAYFFGTAPGLATRAGLAPGLFAQLKEWNYYALITLCRRGQ